MLESCEYWFTSILIDLIYLVSFQFQRKANKIDKRLILCNCKTVALHSNISTIITAIRVICLAVHNTKVHGGNFSLSY